MSETLKPCPFCGRAPERTPSAHNNGSAGQDKLSVSDVTALAKTFGATVTPGFDDHPPVVRFYDSQLRHFANSLSQPVDQQARRHANTLLNCLAGFDANPHPGSKADLARQWLRSLAHPEIPNKE